MKTITPDEAFETLLMAKLDTLPFDEHADAGHYNDGVMTGFEMGANWAYQLSQVTPKSIQKTYTMTTWINGQEVKLTDVSLNKGEYHHPVYGKLDKSYVKNVREL